MNGNEATGDNCGPCFAALHCVKVIHQAVFPEMLRFVLPSNREPAKRREHPGWLNLPSSPVFSSSETFIGGLRIKKQKKQNYSPASPQKSRYEIQCIGNPPQAAREPMCPRFAADQADKGCPSWDRTQRCCVDTLVSVQLLNHAKGIKHRDAGAGTATSTRKTHSAFFAPVRYSVIRR